MLNNIHTPKWGNEEKTLIVVSGTLEGHGEVSFAACANDSEAHGREIHSQAMNGDYGVIADYEAPKPPAPPEPTADDIAKDTLIAQYNVHWAASKSKSDAECSDEEYVAKTCDYESLIRNGKLQETLDALKAHHATPTTA